MNSSCGPFILVCLVSAGSRQCSGFLIDCICVTTIIVEGSVVVERALMHNCISSATCCQLVQRDLHVSVISIEKGVSTKLDTRRERLMPRFGSYRK